MVSAEHCFASSPAAAFNLMPHLVQPDTSLLGYLRWFLSPDKPDFSAGACKFG
jgi:hypothetical protein